MDIKKKKPNDIVELANKKWKVIITYTANKNFYYKDRMIMINVETGQKINCANSLT